MLHSALEAARLDGWHEHDGIVWHFAERSIFQDAVCAVHCMSMTTCRLRLPELHADLRYTCFFVRGLPQFIKHLPTVLCGKRIASGCIFPAACHCIHADRKAKCIFPRSASCTGYLQKTIAKGFQWPLRTSAAGWHDDLNANRLGAWHEQDHGPGSQGKTPLAVGTLNPKRSSHSQLPCHVLPVPSPILAAMFCRSPSKGMRIMRTRSLRLSGSIGPLRR